MAQLALKMIPLQRNEHVSSLALQAFDETQKGFHSLHPIRAQILLRFPPYFMISAWLTYFWSGKHHKTRRGYIKADNSTGLYR